MVSECILHNIKAPSGMLKLAGVAAGIYVVVAILLRLQLPAQDPLVFAWPWGSRLDDIALRLEQHIFHHHSKGQYLIVVDKTAGFASNYRQTASSENGTFVVLCRNSDIFALLETMQSINDRYNKRFHHDWVFLNDEPFDEFFITGVSMFADYGRLSFGLVPLDHWGYPLWIDQQLAKERRLDMGARDVHRGDSESYRHMCRFFLGFFHKHPLVAQYRYYWRVEPGVRLYCDVEYDVFRFMREKDKRYGFAIALFEYRDTVPTLWTTARDHFARQHVPKDNMEEFLRNGDGSYNLCHFWLNFEVGDLGFFASPEYEAYFTHLDRAGGFYYERWGDAPVHSIAAAHLLSGLQLWWFGDFGYYHPPYLQCPQGKQHAVGRCSCDRDLDFTAEEVSCVPHFLHIQAQVNKN